jgi:basic membrane protein A and related proteins
MRRLGPAFLVVVLATLLCLGGAVAAVARVGSGRQTGRVVLVTFGCNRASLICFPFERALRQTGVSGRIISPDLREDAVGTLSLLARQDYDAIFVDLTFSGALAVVAPRFPHVHFVLVDAPLDALPGRPRNVQAFVALPHESSYLAGWLAARLEQRRPGKDVVGVVGGVSVPSVDDFIVGFSAGARAADPGIQVLVKYSNDFTDPDKCAALARNEIARGAGTVFNVAGACGLGTLAATERARVWGIGVDLDQSFLGTHILTSVVKGYATGITHALEQVRRGTLRTGGTTVLTLRDGGSRLGRINREVPASLVAELARVRTRILEGKIVVPRANRG